MNHTIKLPGISHINSHKQDKRGCAGPLNLNPYLIVEGKLAMVIDYGISTILEILPAFSSTRVPGITS